MQSKSKYFTLKKCLFGLALLVYLMGIFRHGIFEVVHALSHQFTGKHSYYSHHADERGLDHKHTILDASKAVMKASKDTPISQNEKSSFSFDVKLCVTVPTASQPTSIGTENKPVPFFNLRLPLSPFLQTTTPPPDFII